MIWEQWGSRIIQPISVFYRILIAHLPWHKQYLTKFWSTVMSYISCYRDCGVRWFFTHSIRFFLVLALGEYAQRPKSMKYCHNLEILDKKQHNIKFYPRHRTAWAKKPTQATVPLCTAIISINILLGLLWSMQLSWSPHLLFAIAI